MAAGLQKLVNVDGVHGRNVVPYPHSALLNPDARKYDHMSVADRLADVKDDLTPTERRCVEAFVLLCSGATLETTSFFEFLHWWALCGYSYEGCINHLVKYKFKGGQSSFAVRFFGEALASGNLAYAFNQPVAAVRDSADGGVQVTTRSGQTFRAARMISAVPLNVLGDVKFDPPFSPGRRQAAKIGHVNQTVKVHAEIADRDLRSFTGISYPHNGLIYGFGDGETPAGNTHVVAFGGQHNHFHPEDSIDQTMAHFKGFAPMDIQRIVSSCRGGPRASCFCLLLITSTNRSSTIGPETNLQRGLGKFAAAYKLQSSHPVHSRLLAISKPANTTRYRFFSSPGLLANHLKDMRERQGNIFFACSDWALGWRSFIDGAIEEGGRAASAVRADLLRTFKANL